MSKASQHRKELAEYRAEQKFHEREWAVQRIGWAALTIVLVAGVAGVFGNGPLAHHAMTVEDVRIEMDRFVRYASAVEWRFVPTAATSTNPLRIHIDSDFVSQYEITAITPEPARTSSNDRFVVFEFESDRSTAAIVFHVEPMRMWRHQGAVRVHDSAPIVVRQFVYP